MGKKESKRLGQDFYAFPPRERYGQTLLTWKKRRKVKVIVRLQVHSLKSTDRVQILSWTIYFLFEDILTVFS